MVVADSNIIYWYLGQSERLSKKALQCLTAAEYDEGIVVSGVTVFELRAVSTRKEVLQGVPLIGYDQVRAVLMDPATAVSVRPFGPDMRRYFIRASAVLPDPFDAAIVATALVLDTPLATVDRAIIATNLVETIS